MQYPLVQTTNGPVRGFHEQGVNVFKAVRYGANTGGANRFLAPRPPAPWSRVCDCFQAPPIASQRTGYHRRYSEVLRGAYDAQIEETTNYVAGSEDCLFLNVWSPSLDTNAKLAVIVWVHPGALWGWSGWSPWTDGGNLSRQEKVVVVSFNHRLGPFGFLYLGHLDPTYDEAANPGLLDMISLLGWVKQNVSAFGGDENNVTLMGESGGAGKIYALLASKPAAGLFHKAIIMGGTPRRAYSRTRAAKRTSQILDQLGIREQVFRELHKSAAEDILRAVGSVYPSIVVSGPAMTHHPFGPDSQSGSENVPILIGATSDEMTYLTLTDDFPDELDQQSANRRLVEVGWAFNAESADVALAAARQLEPASSWRRLFILAASAAYRDDHLITVERRQARNCAPAYMYLFDWKSPAFDGRYGAMHVFDVPFAFGNTHAAPQIFGHEPDPRRLELEENIRKAWAAFARSGNPRHSGLPKWEPYNLEGRDTMVLNYTCSIVSDPMKDIRMAFHGVRSAHPPTAEDGL